MGRTAAIAVAAIAGIASLPALLGSDKPPPVPADVGLASPAMSVRPSPAPEPAASPPAPKSKRAQHRLVGAKSRRGHSHPHREHRHPHRPDHGHHLHHHRLERTPAAPSATSTTAPPVYSYVPPPAAGEFRFER